jgi:hypothetical protein
MKPRGGSELQRTKRSVGSEANEEEFMKRSASNEVRAVKSVKRSTVRCRIVRPGFEGYTFAGF